MQSERNHAAQLAEATRRFREALSTAYREPASEIEMAFAERVAEVETSHPGKGPDLAARDLLAGRLHTANGGVFAPLPGQTAEHAADAGAHAFALKIRHHRESSLRAELDSHTSRFRTALKAVFGSESNPVERAFQNRIAAIEATNPGSGPSTAAHELVDGHLAKLPSNCNRADLVAAASAGEKAFDARLALNQLERYPAAPERETVLRPPKSPQFHDAEAALESATEARRLADQVTAAKQSILEASSAAKRIHQTDQSLDLNQRRLTDVFRRMYRQPETAMKRFDAAAARDPKKAIEALRSNPKKFGSLHWYRSGLLTFSREATAEQGDIAANYAVAIQALAKAANRPMTYTDPTGKEYSGKDAVLAAATRTIATEGLKIDGMEETLSSLGGIRGSTARARDLVQALPTADKEQLSELIKGMATKTAGKPPISVPVFQTAMTAQQVAGSVTRVMDPPM